MATVQRGKLGVILSEAGGPPPPNPTAFMQEPPADAKGPPKQPVQADMFGLALGAAALLALIYFVKK